MHDTPTGDFANDNHSLGSIISHLAHVLNGDHFPTGERAALRRMAPSSEPGLAYWRLWPIWLRRDPPPDVQTSAWSVIVAGLALMSPSGHQRGHPFGKALADAGFSDFRLERLLAADDDTTRLQLFARALRFVAAKGTGFDWTTVAAWLLAGPETRATIARSIARDFYRSKDQ